MNISQPESIQDSYGSQQNMIQKMNRQPSESRLNLIIQKNFSKKQQLGTSFTGIIKSGVFKNQSTLNVLYALKAGPAWQLIDGQPSGISQKSSGSDNRIVWNFPFAATYQTKSIVDWPQIMLVLYGTDYFGRSLVEAYGNTYLPTSEGKTSKKVRLYKVLQPSSIWSCLNIITANLFEFRQPQNHLLSDDIRNSIKTQCYGQIQIQVELKRINFDRNGYQ